MFYFDNWRVFLSTNIFASAGRLFLALLTKIGYAIWIIICISPNNQSKSLLKQMNYLTKSTFRKPIFWPVYQANKLAISTKSKMSIRELTKSEIETELRKIKKDSKISWTLSDDKRFLSTRLKFKNFNQAWVFMTAIALKGEIQKVHSDKCYFFNYRS